MHDVVLLRAARADLAGIFAFSMQAWSETVAQDYLAGIDAALETIGAFPAIGAVVRRVRPITRQFIHRKHRIFYRFDHATVTVARIIHVARDSRRLLKHN